MADHHDDESQASVSKVVELAVGAPTLKDPPKKIALITGITGQVWISPYFDVAQIFEHHQIWQLNLTGWFVPGRVAHQQRIRGLLLQASLVFNLDNFVVLCCLGLTCTCACLTL
jgi:hypothetical protein